MEAAEAAIRVLRPAGGQRTLAQVTEELRANKKERLSRGELDQRTHDDFKSRTLKIDAALGSRLVSTVTGDDLGRWLRQVRTQGLMGDGEALSQRSVLNYRNTLAEASAMRRRGATALRTRWSTLRVRTTRPWVGRRRSGRLTGSTFLRCRRLRKLLTAAAETADLRPLLPSLVLRLFCGLRTAEVCRLDWSEVRWADSKPFVHIPAGKAKKRRIRLVDIPENALAWLRLSIPQAFGLVVPGNGKVKGYCKRFARLVAKADLSDWGNNDTRHSFGSYHYALHGDAVRTSAQMGHKQGDDTLFSHYRTLVTKEDAERFFGLKPDADSAKVLVFPTAAGA